MCLHKCKVTQVFQLSIAFQGSLCFFICNSKLTHLYKCNNTTISYCKLARNPSYVKPNSINLYLSRFFLMNILTVRAIEETPKLLHGTIEATIFNATPYSPLFPFNVSSTITRTCYVSHVYVIFICVLCVHTAMLKILQCCSSLVLLIFFFDQNWSFTTVTYVDLSANFYYAAYQGKTKILIEEYHQKYLRNYI